MTLFFDTKTFSQEKIEKNSAESVIHHIFQTCICVVVVVA